MLQSMGLQKAGDKTATADVRARSQRSYARLRAHVARAPEEGDRRCDQGSSQSLANSQPSHSVTSSLWKGGNDGKADSWLPRTSEKEVLFLFNVSRGLTNKGKNDFFYTYVIPSNNCTAVIATAL